MPQTLSCRDHKREHVRPMAHGVEHNLLVLVSTRNDVSLDGIPSIKLARRLN